MTTRLKSIKSGVIVSVSDEKAARLGSEWEPVKASVPKSAEKPAPKSNSK
jgi:hypothetical protein